MKKYICALILATTAMTAPATENNIMGNNYQNFYKSESVTPQKVSFKNQYNLSVVGNLYLPKDMDASKTYPAIVVGHPMGAVKEQASNLYAQKLAEQGFITLAIDLSYWGESEGLRRNNVAPEIFAEDFSAAVDYLGTQSFVDRGRIGALGICASGSYVISAAKIDPRISAIATVSMYNMGDAARNGLKNSVSVEQRKQMIVVSAEQRYGEFEGGEIQLYGLPAEIGDDADPITKEFYDFYRTPRGEYIPEGSTRLRTTARPASSEVRFMNFYPFNDIETISPRPLLFIAGENAHSFEFSQDAYDRAAEPKELYIVPNAGHVDLYDNITYIPFDKLTSFYTKNLSAE